MNSQSAWRDPIVEEIHHIRHELVERYHHDLDAMTKAMDDKAKTLGFTTKRPPSRTDAIDVKTA